MGAVVASEAEMVEEVVVVVDLVVVGAAEVAGKIRDHQNQSWRQDTSATPVREKQSANSQTRR